jgi:hypothetical protein
MSSQLKNATECQQTTVKNFAKSQQKQISKKLTQVKNTYLLESFFWSLIVNAPEKDPDCN